MNTKKSLKTQFCARCGKKFARYKIQTYCSHSCSSKARGERGLRGLDRDKLAEQWKCVHDPEPCHGAGFRGWRRSLWGWLLCRDGLVLENDIGEQITLPDVATRLPAEPRTDPVPETAELRFGERRSMRRTCVRIG